MRPLIEIVKEYATLKGYDSAHEFERLISSAIRGLRNLSYDVSGVSKEVTLTLDSDNSVDMPDGYIRHILVRGVLDGGGYVDLVQSTGKPKKDECGNLPFTNSCEFKGTFVENWAMNRLEFGTDYQFSSVWIRYTADPEKVDKSYMVHPFIEEPLLLWMDYDLYRFSNNVGRGEKIARRSAFQSAKDWSRKRFKSKRREEFSVVIRRGRKRFKG